MRILFAGRPIACKLGALKVFNENFICRQAHCYEMCVLEVFILESEFSLLVGPLHMKWVYKFT